MVAQRSRESFAAFGVFKRCRRVQRPRAPVQDALFWFRFNNLLLGVGSGKNLNKRFLSDRTITVDDLRARMEYIVSLTPGGLRLLNADDSAARRSIGAHSMACFQANHVVSRQ